MSEGTGLYRHILLPSSIMECGRYRARPVMVPKPSLIAHPPLAHADNLRQQLRRAQADPGQMVRLVELISEPGLPLTLESLESPRFGLELLMVRQLGERQHAVVRLDHAGLRRFEKMLDAYQAPPPNADQAGRPRHSALLDSISEIRAVLLDTFWTDDPGQFPSEDSEGWEIWLRQPDPQVDVLRQFREEAAPLGVLVGATGLRFPDRVVCLAQGPVSQLGRCALLLDRVAELRRARPFKGALPVPVLFDALDFEPLYERIVPPTALAPVICLLGTGADLDHPLLAPASVYAETQGQRLGRGDGHGHGTAMAGLALYGDLRDNLKTESPLALQAHLEALRTTAEDADICGASTVAAIAQVERQHPHAQRIYCLSGQGSRPSALGRPGAWSATLDHLAAGADGGPERLFIVAAGDNPQAKEEAWPEALHLCAVSDPAQAWNVLTVGSYTQRTELPALNPRHYRALAHAGEASPHSSTSVHWERPWPAKPELVFEGGNLVEDPCGERSILDAHSLVSTAPDGKYATLSGTTASAALATRMASVLWAAYPDLWPQAIRALMVHSARWTPAMRKQIPPTDERRKRLLLRTCGWGVPSLEEALHSGGDALTLIVQQQIQPFEKQKSSGRMRDIHFHSLPWPKDELTALGNTRVELRVTLSYFIEPSPGERGRSSKHAYASHGLRFEVCGATESPDDFRMRLSSSAEEEEGGRKIKKPQDSGWTLGSRLRNSGSIHSDIWQGSAADLAQRGLIGVYPVLGWWRERLSLGKVAQGTRYALIVSLRPLEKVQVDLYHSVEHALMSPL